jgi:hypothetical protein
MVAAMIVNTEDVMEGVKLLWAAASPALPALIEGRIPKAQASPYTTFEVEDGDIIREGQGSILAKFLVTFRTWDEAGIADAGTIKARIEAAFTILTRTVLTLPSTRTLQILDATKVPGGGIKQDDATTKAQAVAISTDRVQFFVQG